MTSSYYFVIVGHQDNPVYEIEFFPPSRVNDPKVGVMLKYFHYLTWFLILYVLIYQISSKCVAVLSVYAFTAEFYSMKILEINDLMSRYN